LVKLVLEPGREPVGLVPGVAEHVGKEALDDAVPADRGDGQAAAADRQLDPVVRLVVDEPAVGQTLDGRGDGAGRQAQPLGEDPGVGPAVLGQAVDRLQRLAVALRQARKLCFDAREVRFRSPKKSRANLLQPGSLRQKTGRRAVQMRKLGQKSVSSASRQFCKWYGTEVTTVPFRNRSRAFSIRALWLWSSWPHHEPTTNSGRTTVTMLFS